MRARPFVSVAAALAVAFVIPSSARAGAWVPVPGEYYSQFTASRFYADTYYLDDGTRATLSEIQEERRLTSYNELGWKKRASLILAVPALSITNRAGKDLGYASRTETGLGDLRIGVLYRLKGGPTALALQADWLTPLGYQHDSIPSLGSGRQSLGAALHFGAGIPRINGFLELSGSGRGRIEKPPAQEITPLGYWGAPTLYQPPTRFRREYFGSATVAVWVRKSVLLSGSYLAQYASSGTTPEKNYVVVVSPQVLYRVDERLDLLVGSHHTAAGKSVLHIDEFYIGMAFKQTRLNRLQGFLGGTKSP